MTIYMNNDNINGIVNVEHLNNIFYKDIHQTLITFNVRHADNLYIRPTILNMEYNCLCISSNIPINIYPVETCYILKKNKKYNYYIPTLPCSNTILSILLDKYNDSCDVIITCYRCIVGDNSTNICQLNIKPLVSLFKLIQCNYLTTSYCYNNEFVIFDNKYITTTFIMSNSFDTNVSPYMCNIFVCNDTILLNDNIKLNISIYKIKLNIIYLNRPNIQQYITTYKVVINTIYMFDNIIIIDYKNISNTIKYLTSICILYGIDNIHGKFDICDFLRDKNIEMTINNKHICIICDRVSLTSLEHEPKNIHNHFIRIK